MMNRKERAVRRLAAIRASLGAGNQEQEQGLSLSKRNCSEEQQQQQQAPVSVPPHVYGKPRVSSKLQYDAMYQQAHHEPNTFWSNEAKSLYWLRVWDETQPVCTYNFDRRNGPIFVEWFRGGYTNACYNALDKHVKAGHGDKLAILWEGNDPGCEARLTYNDLLKKTCQLANFLKSRNVKKGDRVCIYMPMIPELPIAMLACARIGAIHSVVFGGFSAESLAGRILDCKPKAVLTCSAVKRGAKSLLLKQIVDHALNICMQRESFCVGTCLVYDNFTASPRDSIPWKADYDLWWQDIIGLFSEEAQIEWMESEEPLFMLYTSGSTGKPKGVIHTVGGYMVYATTTFKYYFDPRPEDVFWCTADCGWITGHTYVAYGPFFNCATCVLFEGIPNWPDAGRCWEIVEKYKVSTFYTAPTLIRSLKAYGNEVVKKHSLSTLRLLATAGEPINPKAWSWFFEIVGEGRCPILDTWWQTETGGIMIAPLPALWPLKPGSATLPFFGVEPVVLDPQGREQDSACEGYLCIKKPWPGIARTIYEDHKRYEDTYFSTWPGYYNTGDGCVRDGDGYIWITGRVDDVINVSGHRISTSEVESALALNASCAEAAVVAIDHEVKGQGMCAFVTLLDNYKPSEDLKKSLEQTTRAEIGAFAVPDLIYFVPALPKTRSGKIMRHILRKIASNKIDNLGDISTLADPSVVTQIIKLKMK